MHMKKQVVLKRLTREEQRQRTNLSLRVAAMGEFARYGVEGTSAERIAEAAGFSRGAFYANYPNKQALLLDLLSEKLSDELASWRDLSASVVDLEALFSLLDQRSLRFDPDRTWAMVAASINLHAQRSPEFAESYRVYHGQILAGFGVILHTLFRRAGKQEPLAVEELADALLTLYRTNRLPEKSGDPPRGFSSDMLILIIRGLIAVAPALEEKPQSI